jgi:hypothetical protein
VFDQGDHLVFLARVRSKAVCRAAGLAYLGQQWLKLFLCSVADAGGIAFARKASGNRASGGITRAYDQTDF